jgi:hypothetical protein
LFEPGGLTRKTEAWDSWAVHAGGQGVARWSGLAVLAIAVPALTCRAFLCRRFAAGECLVLRNAWCSAMPGAPEIAFLSIVLIVGWFRTGAQSHGELAEQRAEGTQDSGRKSTLFRNRFFPYVEIVTGVLNLEQ